MVLVSPSKTTLSPDKETSDFVSILAPCNLKSPSPEEILIAPPDLIVEATPVVATLDFVLSI
ncbi:hypothetical protein BAZSYMA_ACONTIG03627_1 [Bathymodiolus azoricus thioautotrophic gill symbiont]|uniref:Uncharacterized protein n=1 Tax=Bathymodiolus azoricus thioautotrophic gill symbiont TaxID=235205 RepID=A0A1H6JXA9_9GAMM|nr:hypothetical protein BAZSYMA_ACONTIG03627_1 [Bathymodiolus azoricus thioautotrophic gill symbiont]